MSVCDLWVLVDSVVFFALQMLILNADGFQIRLSRA